MTKGSTRWRYPISVVLAALMILPLIGVGWFTISQLRTADVARERADRIDALTQDFLELTELRTALLDERNWFSALVGVEELGLDLATVTALTGIEIGSTLESARSAADRATLRLDLADVALELERLRQDDEGGLLAIADGYTALEEKVADESALVLAELTQTVGDMEGAGDLSRTLRNIEDAAAARQAAASELTSYFNARFTFDQNSPLNLRLLIVQIDQRRSSLARIGETAPSDSFVAAALEQMAADAEAAFFDEAIEQYVDGALARSAPLGGGDFLADIDAVSRLFAAGSGSIDAALRVVEAAARDVIAATDSLSDRADGESERALMVAGLVVLGSSLLAVVAARAVGQPMARLAASARQLRDGESAAARVSPGGPVEVRAAMEALNEAAANIELAETQATALAAGDLHNEVLDAPAPGRLGTSLQTAVKTLAASMQEREEFRQRMTHEASHDGLTRLANRNATLDHLSKARSRSERSESELAVLFIDLDGFKDVNDQHGHAVGDRVLEQAAQRLLAAVRDGDHVGRLGGDEFLVVAEPVADAQAAVELAERLVSHLSVPVLVNGVQVMVGASIGVAMNTPGTSTSRLLRDADIAVYEAKAAGRGRVTVCDDDLRRELAEREALEIALRRAIREDELELYFQPIVTALGHRLVGVEALVRWNRPGHGLVMPDAFIPVAERSDLVTLLDRWVIGALARQVDRWQDEEWFADVAVAVNLSARHLGSDSFIDDVLIPLTANGFGSRVIAEVTESAVVEDLDQAAEKLERLRAADVRIAIDDFGTGFTSLAHLRSLPIDILKIDRSFVNDPEAASLVQLIIDTGHLLGATIVAEGIESDEAAQRLAVMGADELQGYFFSRPAPAAELGPDHEFVRGVRPRSTVVK